MPTRPIVIRTMALLRELTKEYGSTKSMEIWEQLSDLLPDADLKMEVFKLMLLGGRYGTNIELRYWNAQYKKVPAIKALRVVTNLGLKEAKDAVDRAEHHNKTTIPIRITLDMDGNREDIDYDAIMDQMRVVGLDIEIT
jgi:ribosomal protein L7/L12